MQSRAPGHAGNSLTSPRTELQRTRLRRTAPRGRFRKRDESRSCTHGGGAAARPPGRGARAGTSVSFRLPVRHVTNPAWLLPPLLLGLVLLPGCQDGYSESMVFPVRTDPLVVDVERLANLVGEPYEQDQPGQLPPTSLKNRDDSRNPFYFRPSPYAESEERAKYDEKVKDRRDKLTSCFFDPTTLGADVRSQIQAALEKAFGTPAN